MNKKLLLIAISSILTLALLVFFVVVSWEVFIFDVSDSERCCEGECRVATTDDNSFDADGVMWATEIYPDYLNEEIKDILTNNLKIKNFKVRMQSNFFSKDGKTFSPVLCMPSANNCKVTYDFDSVAKTFKENNWSMIPMFTHDHTKTTVTSEDIDNYVSFVDWFISRYKNDANIKYIELINAPGSWWKGTEKQLLEVNNNVYEKVKSKYPDIMIGTPGFEYWNDASGENSIGSRAVRQIEYFLDKNNGAKFDYWAFHGYPLLIVDTGAVYPPTKKAIYNKYGGIYGILEIRKILNENGWENRAIIDAEHSGTAWKKTPFTENEYKLDAAYMMQELLLKRTLQYNSKNVLAGILPLKIAPHGDKGEFVFASLRPDGSITPAVTAVSILWDKFNEYNWVAHISGEFDNENQVWIEKFKSGGNKELYIFFKPFEYKEGQPLSFDNKTVDYTLNLSKQPSSVKLTYIDGSTKDLTPARSITLEAENSPKFLEVSY